MQNNLPKALSVVVPAYNEEHRIWEALRNIVESRLNANHVSFIEVIVVNDASTDRTLSAAKDFVSQCSECESFKIIDCQINSGAGHAFWMGASVATCEFITLVPGDGIFAGESLTNLFREFSPIGVTLTTRINKHQRNRLRRLCSNLIGIWFSWIVDKRVQDPHSLFVFPTAAVNDAYKAILPTLNDDKDQRLGFEYHLRILQWILKTHPISKTIEVEVITKLEESSNSTSPKVLLNFLKHYGRMTLNKLQK
jgi:hypothetical protein